jgi:hypothetical protein
MFNDEAYIKEFVEIVKGLNIKTAMETGHGSGELVEALRAAGIDACGIDKSSDLLRVPKAAHYQNVPLEELVTRKKYDLVYSSGVLEHFDGAGDVEFIKRMAALSKKYVLNLVPSAKCAAYKAAKARTKAEWKTEKDYTADALLYAHVQAGLKVHAQGFAGQEWAKRWGPEPSSPYLVYVIGVKK